MGRKKHYLHGLSGIYQIRNTLNGKIYIGSAKVLSSRWTRHLHDLRHGKHHSAYLQRSFNKHGETAFVFEVLEVTSCSEDILKNTEQGFINRLKPEYNMSDDAIRNTPRKEAQARTAEINAREYIVTYPDGRVVEVKNLAKFSRDNGLTDNMMMAVVRGKQFSHRGFKARRKDNPFPEYKLKTEKVRYITKDGVDYEIRNVKAFCREHDLCYQYITGLLSGRYDTAYGFRLKT